MCPRLDVVRLRLFGCIYLAGNRHIAAPKGTQLADVMLSVAQKYGAEIDRFGVSSNAFAL